MRRRHRHLTLGRSGASACWDSRALTESDNTSITSWTDRAASLSATTAGFAPVVRRNIQGGQPIVRFPSTSTPPLVTGNVSVTANKTSATIVGVASSTQATTNNYPTIVNSRITGSSANARCYLALRTSKVESGGRRTSANSYQFVQSPGTIGNSVFCVASGVWDWGNAALWSYL